MIRGPIPTFYGGDGPEAEVRACEAILRSARPRTVQLHTWSPERAAERVRRLLGPDVQIVVGVGVDGIARDAATGAKSVAQSIESMRVRAATAHELGAVALVWNAEASWKRPPTSAEARRLAEVIRGGLARVADCYPALEQHHTAYDHPTYHSTYPWRAWLGEGSPIVASWPQVYAAPGGNAMARAGDLGRREARALGSWAAAIRAGWIDPDDASTPVRDGVAWRPYYQLHHVPARDTIAAALAHEGAMLWALRSRSDDEGRRACGVLCALDRLGYWRPTGVQEFQAAHGLTPDGVVGPLTLAALDVAT
jgi:hypothetical protein